MLQELKENRPSLTQLEGEVLYKSIVMNTRYEDKDYNYKNLKEFYETQTRRNN